jgi:biotin transport system ATP-binding protein
VYYRGEPVSKNISLVRQRIGLVFQEPDNQLIGQTVAEDVAFGPENLGLEYEEIRHRVEESLGILGLKPLRAKAPSMLSGGEKRKTALAGILAMRPEIIILDEPFAGLDLPGVRSLLESLTLLHSAGHTMIVITHDIEKVLAHAGRLMVLSEGRIVADGSPEDVVDEVEAYGIRAPAKGLKLRDMTWLR